MHTQLLIGAGMLAATAMLVWVGSARADPPPSGMMVSFAHPMIVCDKAEYLKDLVAAQRVSEDAFGAKAKELISDKHVCVAAQVSNMVVGESEDVGNVKWGDQEEHLWITHIGDAKAEHWALYEELVATKHDTAI
jgi:hypothetical protein